MYQRFFFDDFHHNGVATNPELKLKMIIMNAGPFLLDAFYGKDNEFWQQLKEHSSYDDFGKKEAFCNT
jgi:hypothetical protein